MLSIQFKTVNDGRHSVNDSFKADLFALGIII